MKDTGAIQKTECFLFDLDGTVYLGDSLLPGTKELLEYLKPRIDYPDEFLALKSRDELAAIKAVVEKTVAPTFKSSAPLSYSKGPSARQKLDSKHEDYMKKLRGES